MINNLSIEPHQKERVFLRIPVELSAKVLIEKNVYSKATIHDLSSTGLSLYIDRNVQIPNTFRLIFKIPGHLRKIKIDLEVMNRHIFDKEQRIGCRFADLPIKVKHIITNYINRFTSFFLCFKYFTIAAFLIFIDSLWRIIAFFAIRYYINTPFFIKASPVETVPHNYLPILIIYSIFSFFACYYSGRIEKKNLFLSIIFIIPASIFLLAKNIIYWNFHLWKSQYFLIRVFFWSEIMLFLYIEFAFIFLLSSLKRINIFSKTISEHVRHRPVA